MDRSILDGAVLGPSLDQPVRAPAASIRPGAARLVFANQLRGLAALSVVISHLFGVFWLMRDFVAKVTFSPVQPGPVPGVVRTINFAWFEPGPFGVGLFFLVSGLVVPMSLERHTRLSFLGARILRIYPTYMLALLIEVAVLAAAARYWGRPFTYDAHAIVANALLVANLLGIQAIDLVNWTLAVELKFYLLLALIAPSVRRCGIGALFASALLLLAAVFLLSHASAAYAQSLSLEGAFLVFMLIGVLFNYRLRGRLPVVGFVAGIAALVGIFIACWRIGPMAPYYPVVIVNYGYALGLFWVLYGLRHRIRPVRFLDAVAAISFPLYLVHALIGYSVLKLALLSLRLGYPAALALAFASVAAIATALHVTVELRTIRAGRRLARGVLPQRRRPRVDRL